MGYRDVDMHVFGWNFTLNVVGYNMMGHAFPVTSIGTIRRHLEGDVPQLMVVHCLALALQQVQLDPSRETYSVSSCPSYSERLFD